MKILLIALFGLFLINPNASFAKKDTTIFYCNKELKKVREKYASYYAKIYLQKDGTYGVQQFMEDGTLVMKGTYLQKNLKNKQGQFIYYDTNGLLQKSGAYMHNGKTGIWKYTNDKGIITKEGKYENDQRTGEWVFHSDKGVKNCISNYVNGKYEGVFLEWFADTLVTKGQYKQGEKVGYWQGWYSEGSKDYHGNYVNGLRDGEWKFYFDANKTSAIESYQNGEAIKVEWFDIEGKPVIPKEPLEQELSFPGGEDAMNQFILNNINYPELAREGGEQGVILVAFVIEEDGTLTDIKIKQSVSNSLDNESIRLIKKMPRWIPRIDHGRSSRIDYVLPFHFRLG
ncbi:MAG: TonB family protein [Crocinitomix sp.]|jgi:TonB family protein